MASSLHKVLVAIGLIGLLHAAYSATQHRTYLRLTEQEFTDLPIDILFQCLVCLCVTCYGVVHVAGDFKETRATADLDHKTWETFSNRQSFYSFNHRGKVLNRGAFEED
ncbi:ER membrane protein complex subunit 5-like isoform X2 [Lineus longissimus]|uniref:ER membrane protein complex subunit 5-like isoform X2 n=1 Tax=Lineus longissimus TaxID=88925 RepID=UPI00315C8CA8